MSFWDTLTNDMRYLKEKVSPAPSFQLPKVAMQIASNIGQKLKPMAVGAGKALFSATPAGAAYNAYQQTKTPQFQKYVAAPVKQYFAPAPQMRARDFVRELPGATLKVGRGMFEGTENFVKQSGNIFGTGLAYWNPGNIMGKYDKQYVPMNDLPTLRQYGANVGRSMLEMGTTFGAPKIATSAKFLPRTLYGLGTGYGFDVLPRLANDEKITAGTFKPGFGTAVGGLFGAASKPSLEQLQKSISGRSISNIKFNYKPQPGLSASDRAVEQRFGQEISQNLPGMVKLYNKKFGNIINTDNVRELSVDYLRNKSELSSAVHEPSSALTKLIYNIKLNEPLPKGKKNWVVFTAGGSGAGKSTAIENMPLVSTVNRKARLIYDTNLNRTESAVTKINQALGKGNKVFINYVHREPMDAFINGVVPRSSRIGRVVPITEHTNTNLGAMDTIKELSQIYKDNPNVKIRLINNGNGKGKAVMDKLDILNNFRYNGDKLTERLHNTVKKLYGRQEISKEQYKGFYRGFRPSGGRNGTGNVRQFEQAGGTQAAGELKPQPSPFTGTEIGITSFRGTPVKTVGETLPYYESTRAKGFLNSLASEAPTHNLRVRGINKSSGFWEGNIEPSFNVRVKGSENDVLAYAAKHGAKANQDAVVLFKAGEGDGAKYVFDNVKNPDEVLNQLKNHGISGATIVKNKLILYDSDNSLSQGISNLSKELKNEPVITKGQVRFLEKSEYPKYYQAEKTIPVGRVGNPIPAQAPAQTQKISARDEFRVGDIIDPQGGSNMVGPIKVRAVEGNTIKFIDAEGTEYSGMSRATLRNLVNGGAWKRVVAETPNIAPQVAKGGVPILTKPGEGYQLPLLRGEHFAPAEQGPMKLLPSPKPQTQAPVNILKPGKPIALRETPQSPTPPPAVRGGISTPELDFSKWKDKHAWNLGRETLERNIEDIAGADAPKLKRSITEPIAANETKRAEWLTSQRTEVEKLMNVLGIKKGSSEDKLVQNFGEGKISLEQLKKETANWKNVQKASKFFRDKYDEYLNQINSVRQKFGYEPIPKRQDYFRHFQDIGNVIEQFGLIGRKQDLPTSIAGITDIFKPGKPFTTAELRRTGQKTEESAIKGVDNYLQSVSAQIFHTDSVQRVRGLEKYIRTKSLANELIQQGYKPEDANLRASKVVKEMMMDVTKGGDAPESVALPNFVSNISEYGNLLAGKKARMDRAFESTLGRGFYKVANGLRSRTSGNMVGANVSSALTNFIPFTESLATTPKIAAVKGMMESMASPFHQNFNEIGGVKSAFLTRRFPKEEISPTLWENTKNVANWLFNAVDRFTAKSVVAGKYYENIGKGMNPSEAMKLADNYGARLITDRSWGQLPNIMNTRSLGPITQFQAEINNMWSFMSKDMARMAGGNKAKLASMMGQFILYSYLFNNLYQSVTGRRPTIDPIYATGTILGLTEAGKNKPLGKRTMTAVEDIGGNLPFVGGITGGRLPIAAGMPNPFAVMRGESSITKEATKPLAFVLPPFGGLQAQKTIQGLSSYGKGYKENSSGKVQFPIEQNVPNLLRGAVFGQSSFPEANQYYNRESPVPLSEKQSQVFKMGGGKDYYNSVMGQRGENQKVNELKKQIKTGEPQAGEGFFGRLGNLFGGTAGQEKYTGKDYAEAYGYGKLFEPETQNDFGRTRQLQAQKSALLRLYFDDKVPDEQKQNIYKELNVSPQSVEMAAVLSLPIKQKAPFVVEQLRNMKPELVKRGILSFIQQGVLTKAMTREMVVQGLISPTLRVVIDKSIDQWDIQRGLKKPPKGRKAPKMKVPPQMKMSPGYAPRKQTYSGMSLRNLYKVK